jgi:Glycosyl transferase family 2
VDALRQHPVGRRQNRQNFPITHSSGRGKRAPIFGFAIGGTMTTKLSSPECFVPQPETLEIRPGFSPGFAFTIAQAVWLNRVLGVNFLETLTPRDHPAIQDRWDGCVSVIVPVYNEVSHLDELLLAVLASPVKKEVVIVDDGSTDGTREKLLALPPRGDVTIVFHEENCGKGASIRTALTYARGEYVLIQDSDLEYDPKDYSALLEPLQRGRANVVYGVRPDRPERGLRFFLGAKLLTHLTNFLYGTRIHDEATCYKAFRRPLLAQLQLECRRFEFCPEVTSKICRMGEQIEEVPISYRPRSAEEGKKIRLSDGWMAIWTLIRYRFVSRRRWLRHSQSPPPAPFAVSFLRVPE